MTYNQRKMAELNAPARRKYNKRQQRRSLSIATEPTECRSCGMPVYWVVWPKSGKRMPIDMKESPEGDILLSYKREENILEASHVKHYEGRDLAERRKFISHFATCPNADEHRRK